MIYQSEKTNLINALNDLVVYYGNKYATGLKYGMCKEEQNLFIISSYLKMLNHYNVLPEEMIEIYSFSGGDIVLGDSNQKPVYLSGTIDEIAFEIINQSLSVSISGIYNNLLYIGIGVSLSPYKKIKYGYLYNRWAITNIHQITSNASWIVPLNTDYDTLMNYIGSATTAGGFLKSIITSPALEPSWTAPNTAATDTYNFKGLPGGYRDELGNFYHKQSIAHFWTSTDFMGLGIKRQMMYNLAHFTTSAMANKNLGCSVKLVRLASPVEFLLVDGTYCADYIGNNGQAYRTVKIGTQVWTVENLIETEYRDGTSILEITGDVLWVNDHTGAYCSYENVVANAYKELYIDGDVEDGVCSTCILDAVNCVTTEEMYKLYDEYYCVNNNVTETNIP
jgi:uncharacterized protein (TIGR02145 family)